MTMTLFGMINWTFTWLKDAGPLTYAQMAPVVTDLFLNGVTALAAVACTRTRRRAPARRRLPDAARSRRRGRAATRTAARPARRPALPPPPRSRPPAVRALPRGARHRAEESA
ncbi:MAG: hypothetical protein MZV49_09515 [Rhodopseudomonas palustris]|nr:hypothetical protein [Rhodopseudomonas palustris]